jgi:hypothetical protein
MRWRAGVIAVALAGAVVPVPAGLVEQWYSSGLFPTLQSALTTLSNTVPFALFDLLVAATVAWFVWWTTVDIRSGRPRGAWRVVGRAVVRLVTAASCFYLAFLVAWGLNYRRIPLEDKLAFDAGRVSARAARDVALAAVERANALYYSAHARDSAPLDTAALASALAVVEGELGDSRHARPARPKRTLLDPYFKAAGVDGMTDPFFLETFVVSDLFPFETPFVVGHEWAHLAGFADESEANFVGWLTCIHGDAVAQYSGWMFLYSEISGRLSRASRIEVSAHLGEGPRRDLRAVADRITRHVSPPVANAGWRVYDTYLKANRIEAGTASYSAVVRLVVGTTFDDNWTPRLRTRY